MIFHDHHFSPSTTNFSDHATSRIDFFLVIKYIFNIDLGEGHMDDIINIDCQFECEKKIYNLFNYDDYQIFNSQVLASDFQNEFYSGIEFIPVTSEAFNGLELRGPPMINRH